MVDKKALLSDRFLKGRASGPYSQSIQGLWTYLTDGLRVDTLSQIQDACFVFQAVHEVKLCIQDRDWDSPELSIESLNLIA